MAHQIIVADLPSDPLFEETELLELTEGVIVTTLRASLFGVLLAWTPSLLVLACIVRDIRAAPEERD